MGSAWKVLPFLTLLTVAACDCGHADEGELDAGAPDAGSARDSATADAGGTGDAGAAMDAAVDDGGSDRWTTLDAGPDASVEDVVYVHCRAYSDVMCRGSRRCCPEETLRWPCDPPVLHENCERVAGNGALAAGLITFAADAIRTLLDRLSADAESCDAIDDTVKALPFQGTLPEGGDCTPPTLAEPSSAYYRWACAGELVCQITGTASAYTGTCAPPGEEGEPCGLPDDCAPGLHCDFESAPTGSPDTEGTCLPRAANGEPCSTTYECTSDHCECASDACTEGVCHDPSPGETWCVPGERRGRG